MALPVTISAVQFPDQNYYCGPFLSGGNFYVVLLDSTDASIVEVYKATDPTSSFSEQDSANKPNATNNVKSLWVDQDGTDLYISHQEASTQRVGYSIFHMATDLWDGTVVDEAIITPTGVTDVAVGCSISFRSSDSIPIVLYNGTIDNLHGEDRQRVDYARRTGGSWTVDIAVDNAGADSWFGSVIVPGSSDRMHFFFTNFDDLDGFQRTLTSGNVLETFPASGGNVAANVEHEFIPGISYDDGGTQRIRCGFMDPTSPFKASYAEFDSSDTPGAYTVNANVSDNGMRFLSDSPVACLAVDGTDEHLLYADGIDKDLYQDKNDTANVEILDAVSVNRISSNVYNRSGTKLAYVYDDDGTIKYNEVDIAVGGTEINATPAGAATTTLAIAALRAIAAAADGLGASTADVAAIRAFTAQADGAGVTDVTITVVSGGAFEINAASDGVATITVDLAALRAVFAQADGLATASAAIVVPATAVLSGTFVPTVTEAEIAA